VDGRRQRRRCGFGVERLLARGNFRDGVIEVERESRSRGRARPLAPRLRFVDARVEAATGIAELPLGHSARNVMVRARGPARLRTPREAVEPGGDFIQAVVKLPIVRAGTGEILAFARAWRCPLISLSIHGLTNTGPRAARPCSPAGGPLAWAECEISCV